MKEWGNESDEEARFTSGIKVELKEGPNRVESQTAGVRQRLADRRGGMDERRTAESGTPKGCMRMDVISEVTSARRIVKGCVGVAWYSLHE